jgi:hypothetical protein
MFPTLIAGLVLLGCAFRYASAPDGARALLVRRLQLLTFLTGTLGFIAGVIKSFTAASQAPGELGNYVVAGVGESLNNIGLAVGMLIVSQIAMSIGAARRSGTSAELTDPHA